MFTYAQQPQSIQKIIVDTFRLYKTCFTRLWYWSLLFLLIPSLITIPTPQEIQTFSVGMSVLWFAGAMIGFFTAVFGECFLFNRMHNIATQTDSSIRTSLQIAIKKVWPVIGGIILLMLIFLLTALFCGVLGNFIGGAGMYMLLFIVSVFFLISLAFFIPLILFQNLSVLASFKGSFQLIRGHWWRTFLIFFIIFILFFIAFAIISFIINPLADLRLVSILGGLIMNTFLAPFFYAVILIQFNDLKARKLKLTGVSHT